MSPLAGQPLKRRNLYLVLTGLALAVVIYMTMNSASRRTEPRDIFADPPTTKPDVSRQRTMIENLAIIEGVAGDSEKTGEIARLLSQLDSVYPENITQIGDATAGAYGVLEEKGKPASIIRIMEQMLIVAEAKSGISYPDAVATWLILETSE